VSTVLLGIWELHPSYNILKHRAYLRTRFVSRQRSRAFQLTSSLNRKPCPIQIALRQLFKASGYVSDQLGRLGCCEWGELGRWIAAALSICLKSNHKLFHAVYTLLSNTIHRSQRFLHHHLQQQQHQRAQCPRLPLSRTLHLGRHCRSMWRISRRREWLQRRAIGCTVCAAPPKQAVGCAAAAFGSAPNRCQSSAQLRTTLRDG